MSPCCGKPTNRYGYPWSVVHVCSSPRRTLTISMCPFWAALYSGVQSSAGSCASGRLNDRVNVPLLGGEIKRRPTIFLCFVVYSPEIAGLQCRVGGDVRGALPAVCSRPHQPQQAHAPLRCVFPGRQHTDGVVPVMRALLPSTPGSTRTPVVLCPCWKLIEGCDQASALSTSGRPQQAPAPLQCALPEPGRCQRLHQPQQAARTVANMAAGPGPAVQPPITCPRAPALTKCALPAHVSIVTGVASGVTSPRCLSRCTREYYMMVAGGVVNVCTSLKKRTTRASTALLAGKAAQACASCNLHGRGRRHPGGANVRSTSMCPFGRNAQRRPVSFVCFGDIRDPFGLHERRALDVPSLSGGY